MTRQCLNVQDPPHAQGGSEVESQDLPENVHLADEPADDGLTADAIPCDTLAAALLLRSQFPSIGNKTAVPFALRSQLWTIVDRDLDLLR